MYFPRDYIYDRNKVHFLSFSFIIFFHIYVKESRINLADKSTFFRVNIDKKEVVW